jgi:hypothetical protein
MVVLGLRGQEGGVLELKSGNYGLQSVAASDTFAVVENYRGA